MAMRSSVMEACTSVRVRMALSFPRNGGDINTRQIREKWLTAATDKTPNAWIGRPANVAVDAIGDGSKGSTRSDLRALVVL